MVKYYWVNMTRDELVEFIETGDSFQFQFNGQDYLIEGDNFDNDGKGRVGSYMIQQPDVQEDGRLGLNPKYYPEDGKYKNSEELLAAPFLDEQTILQRFDSGELKFFD